MLYLATNHGPFPGFPPLGLGYVAALTPDHWDVEILDENFEVVSFRDCDLVGITGFTAMANRAYQVAEMFREKNVPVVMGGIHASMMPEEAMQFVDAVVIGITAGRRNAAGLLPVPQFATLHARHAGDIAE